MRERIIRKAPNQRLAGLHAELPEDHGINQDLVIPFMEAKGAYHIIAKILNLKYIGLGLFINEETNRKYILTKYGFKLNTDYNALCMVRMPIGYAIYTLLYADGGIKK